MIKALILAAVITTTLATTQSNAGFIYVAEEEPPEPASLPTPVPAILEVIAKCESGSRQFYDDGSVIRGHIVPADTGKFQINSTIWGEKAKELGHDIETLKGNTDMALWLYEKYGTDPWNPSKHCWE